MKNFLLILMIAVVPASAQGWHRFGAPSPGSTELTGDIGLGFAEALNPPGSRVGTGFDVAGGIGVTGSYVGVMFDAMFTDFGLNDATLAAEGARRGSQKYWGLTVDPIFHVNRRGPVDFYVTAGGGVYGQASTINSAFRGASFTSLDTRYGPGADGGAGFAFNLGNHSRAKLFVEARFHHMFLQDGPDANFIPVTMGVRF